MNRGGIKEGGTPKGPPRLESPLFWQHMGVDFMTVARRRRPATLRLAVGCPGK
ncbi:hypothetical protein NH44784_021311 [Achromobacter xylosoxidans NH44784-1996]|nr:hypothetical protein NH44784_021311 [Achromobacter xylosoxidans NH44784-1996]